VRTEARRGRLRVAYRERARLGVDRFLGMLAASSRADGPWLLVSAGSALTLDLLAADGTHVGGLIAPMPATMRQALAAGIRQLDVVGGAREDFATDTADAIASGCDGAAIGLVERSLRLAHARLGVPPTLLLTGGGAGLFEGITGARVVLEPALVLDGLAIVARGGD
jgi:type III pantothenate kinase